MNLKQMEYFTQACKDINFSIAAKHLFITQQALSNTIRNMENELGAKLFERSSRGVELTETGKFLYEKTSYLMGEYAKVVAEIDERFKINQGTISFSVSPGVLRSVSPNILIDFEENFPHIKVKIFEYPDIINENHVKKGDVDIGCSIKPFDMTELDFIHIKSEDLFLIVNNENPLSKKDKVTINDLVNEKLITSGKNFQSHHFLTECCKEAGFTPNIIFESAEIEVLIKLVHLNKGIFMSVKHVADDVKDNNVSIIPVADSSLKWEIGFILKKNAKLSQPLKTFVNYILSNTH
jgi:DNA-binding transcriptional LysR family regulator